MPAGSRADTRPADRRAEPGPAARLAAGAKLFFTRAIFSHLCGITFGDWCRLLRENRFRIHPAYWPRAAVLTLTSLINSQDRWREARRYREQLDGVTIRPPVFIIGHWRSGTTHLHNLLSVDPQFGFPTLLQAFYPHVFLSTEGVYSKLIPLTLTQTRIIDSVAYGAGAPFEDEFALNVATFESPYMGWAFPKRWDDYTRYLTFRGVPEAEVARWKEALVLFLKKVTLKADRPLILKSPPHTCRIRLLLDLFPAARFVHIHRDPYTVYQSTRHLDETMTRLLRFQRAEPPDIEEMLIARYRSMYEVFFEERSLIPEGRFHEVRFEDLERDPLGQLRGIYDRLDLAGFEAAQPAIEAYVASLSGYRKNAYSPLPAPLRRRIGEEWGRSFEEWGYPLD